ncbi:hypothetical protein ACFRAU_12715 [Arthrobacter sp. NPDC056691]|uniref:hypothetical protein n=1 Tax=Arthrobacter sp. NPDC056691 TaxID=3345913 RepID=UPI00366DF77C
MALIMKDKPVAGANLTSIRKVDESQQGAAAGRHRDGGKRELEQPAAVLTRQAQKAGSRRTVKAVSSADGPETGSKGNRLNRTTTAASVRDWGEARRSRLTRLLVLALMAALLMPMFMTVSSSSARAAEEDERDNYSLYKLASSASTYFGDKNSPAADGGMTAEWRAVTSSPSSGGSMLGYADPEFSVGDVVGWFFAEVSGSSQTVMYTTFDNAGGGDEAAGTYAGMLDYAHFGATNQDLGLDTMSSGIGGQIVSVLGGSVIWILYALALAVSSLFYFIIQLLKLMNPFVWFYQAVADSGENGASMADGMTGFDSGGGVLAGLQHWIAGWYGLLQDISWQALVPLFIGFLLISLVLFKKMDRGSAIKKLVVRVVFIGVGLPLIGSMYTGVLDKFDDSMLGSNAGPTRVVLSTYVDFHSWMMNDRLGIPDAASISWDGEQAGSNSMLSVRTTALAINSQSHGSAFNGINIGTKTSDAESAWRAGTVTANGGAADDVRAVFATFGIINDYIGSREVAASDFESGIKTSITKLDIDPDNKKEWFVNDSGKGYDDPQKFGEEAGPAPLEHPVISVQDGLTSSNSGGNTTFTTIGAKSGCGFMIVENGTENPASCNLSPLAAFNYLDTGFEPDSLTMFSSRNATSGFTRENHMAVSQVGTGPAKFMYWHNAATILGSIALLGLWYAIGMLVGAVRRTFSLVAAVPFATLGAVQAIAKVLVYTTALILEVIVTLFIYQFVSEFLISIPDIMSGPMSNLMTSNGLFANVSLGGIVVVILTLISSLVITGVTIGLLKVRKVVLQAMDEVFTKLVDKFLDTNTAPRPDTGGGMMPALASGLGAGAGMAAGQRLASGFDSRAGGLTPPKTGGKLSSSTVPTNAGGTNGEMKPLPAGNQMLALGPGGPDEADGFGGPAGGMGGGSGGGPVRSLPGGSGPAGALGASGDSPDDKGGPLQLAGGSAGSSRLDKQTAQKLSSQGGLSNLGYSRGANGASGDPIVMKRGANGVFQPVSSGSVARSGSQDPDQRQVGSDRPVRPGGGPKTIVGQSAPTLFGAGSRVGQGTDGQVAPQHFSGRAVSLPGQPVASGTPGGQNAASKRSSRSGQGQPVQAQHPSQLPSAQTKVPVQRSQSTATAAAAPVQGQAVTQPRASAHHPQAQTAAPAPSNAPMPSRQGIQRAARETYSTTPAPRPQGRPHTRPVSAPAQLKARGPGNQAAPRPRRVADPAPSDTENPNSPTPRLGEAPFRG